MIKVNFVVEYLGGVWHCSAPLFWSNGFSSTHSVRGKMMELWEHLKRYSINSSFLWSCSTVEFVEQSQTPPKSREKKVKDYVRCTHLGWIYTSTAWIYCEHKENILHFRLYNALQALVFPAHKFFFERTTKALSYILLDGRKKKCSPS